ncbi:glycine betaine ABC transporter substrate-binding protein [Anaerospora sp.]|uniref:glycine betaine ABC transporter substrate-binding protein n=1 Tax=Anaerospora sp. TaxID=1960278 RepID=UPI0028A258A1|nr:glycine betaine ABC transporter substrate-binding protein [Anaerospora sp.]
MKRVLIVLLIAVVVGSLVGCSNNKGVSGDKVNIRIGSKNFTENLIVSEIYALALEDKGYKVERVPNIASSIIHTSLVNGEIDLYPEYTGTGLLAILKKDLLTDPKQVYDTVKSEYLKQFNLVWLNYSSANDGQGLVIRTDVANKLGIKTISDLQKQANEIRFASQGEFDKREDGIPGLEKTYGRFNWKSSRVYDNGLKYEVLASNEADLAPASTTEGQLTKSQFTLLIDDKHVWPPYNLVPVIKKTVLDAHPDIADILNKISASLDTPKITKLNAEVDVEKKEYEEVAKKYYDSIK